MPQMPPIAARSRLVPAMLVLSLAGAAAGQDSVSLDQLGPGDAISAYDTSRQATRFVVDLAPVSSAQGHPLGVAPVLKSSARLSPTGTLRSSALRSVAVSRLIEPASLAVGPYAQWSTAGAGVGPNNDPGVMLDLPAGALSSLAIGFADADGGQSNAVAALVTFDPAARDRVYVDRIVVGSSSPDGAADSSAGISLSAIGSTLNATLRLDGVGATGPSAVLRQDVIRVDSAARNTAAVNALSDAGAADAAATTVVFDGSDPLGTNPIGGVLLAPSSILDAAFGPNTSPLLAGAGFAAVGTDHLVPDPAFVGLLPNQTQRGSLGVAPITPLGGVATAVGLQCGADGIPNALAVFGLDATGTPVSVATFQAPAMIDDPADPFGGAGAAISAFSAGGDDRPFEAASGAAAVTAAADGSVLAAGVVDIACVSCTGTTVPAAPGDGEPSRGSGIAVLRFDPADPAGSQAWTLAAWTNSDTGLGKTVRDDQGVARGMLTTADAFPGNAAGVSISGVAFDAAGNAAFVSPFVDFGDDGVMGTPDDATRVGLFRAVYEPVTLSYEIDLLLGTGDVLPSGGTGLDYRVEQLAFGDSPDGFGAQSATHTGYPSAEPGAIDSLGAAAISAVITYDADQDGAFDTAPGTLDESYAVVLLVQAGETEPPLVDCNGNGIQDADDIAQGTSEDINLDGQPDECQIDRLCADVNGDAIVEPGDFFAWVNAFTTGDYRAEQNGDGQVDVGDFFSWIVNFNQGAAGPLCLQ
ncbi:MAG: GC-type dockerin domain-anchored protein [Planctomycetota bacterium]